MASEHPCYSKEQHCQFCRGTGLVLAWLALCRERGRGRVALDCWDAQPDLSLARLIVVRNELALEVEQMRVGQSSAVAVEYMLPHAT